MESERTIEIPFYYQLPPTEALEAQLHNLGVARQNREQNLHELVELEVAANSLRRALGLDEKKVTYIRPPVTEEIDKLVRESDEKEKAEAVAQIKLLDLPEGVRHEVQYQEYVDLEMSAYTRHFTYAIHRQGDTVLVEFRRESHGDSHESNSIIQYIASPSLDKPLIIEFAQGSKPSNLGLEVEKSKIGSWRTFKDRLESAMQSLEDQASIAKFMQLLENTDIVDGKYNDEKLKQRTFDLGNGLCYELVARYYNDNRKPALKLTEVAIINKLDGKRTKITRMNVREFRYETWPYSYNQHQSSKMIRTSFLTDLKTIQAISGSIKPSTAIE